MNPFLTLFFLITLISVIISGALLLVRRWLGGRGRSREQIQPALFSFFTTLYAFFIGFAMVTLWSAFLTAKKDVIREADAILLAYRTAQNLPGSGAFRQALVNYVKAVVEAEWVEMAKGVMSPEADQRFNDIWSTFHEIKGDPTKTDELYGNIKEAGQQRLSRAAILQGNLYPPVWAILIFGFLSVIYGLYFINRELTAVALIYEFMVIFLVLSCIYFIYDIDTPFSGLITLQPEAFQDVYLKMLSFP